MRSEPAWGDGDDSRSAQNLAWIGAVCNSERLEAARQIDPGDDVRVDSPTR